MGRVPIADRHIALFPQGMLRQVVFFDVTPDVCAAPVKERIDFVASALEFNGEDPRTCLGLRTTQPGKPSTGVTVIECAVQRPLLSVTGVAPEDQQALIS